jgi:hypothetical protein
VMRCTQIPTRRESMRERVRVCAYLEVLYAVCVTCVQLYVMCV